MRMRSCISAASLALFVSSASAQSSVTLYGAFDDGIAWTNNQGGHSNVQLLSGYMLGNRFGLLGKEDLGGGSSAIFRLENGFDSNAGTLSQGGRLFGRSAYLGLDNKMGTVTLGRQQDTNYDLLAAYEFAKYWGGNGGPVGDNDNLFGTVRFNNSVKYISPNLSGLKIGGMYALSNSTSFGDNRAYSITARYERAGFSIGAGYLQLNGPNSLTNPSGAAGNDYPAGYSPFKTSLLNSTATASRQRIFVSGAAYRLNNSQASVVYSHVDYNYLDGTTLQLNNYEASLVYYVTPAVAAGVGYLYANAKYNEPQSSPHWNQIDAGIDYFLSKRTDLYLYGIYQRASGTHASIFLIPASSSRSQALLTAGIRHAF